MATTTRSHSRLLSIPGTEILHEFVQLKDQLQELDKPSADAHETRFEEILRKISQESSRSNSIPMHMRHRASALGSLGKEIERLQEKYERDVASWGEETQELFRQMVAANRQSIKALWEPLDVTIHFDVTWNQRTPESPRPADGETTAADLPDPVPSLDMPPPPAVASPSTSTAASQTQPSRRPTTTAARGSKRGRRGSRLGFTVRQRRNLSNPPAVLQREPPYVHSRHTDFDTVFGNGAAEHRYIILDWARTIDAEDGHISGRFWILRCDICNTHYSCEHENGKDAISNALRHSRSKNHGQQTRERENVLRCFGVVVDDCDVEKARQNNEAVIAAIRSGEYAPETNAEMQRRAARMGARRRAGLNARRSARRPVQAARTPFNVEATPTPAAATAPPEPRPEHHPVEAPAQTIADRLEPGETYIIRWGGGSGRRHFKEPYAGVLLPMGDFESVGLRGRFRDTALAKTIPACYQTATAGDWREDYKDGGPRAHRRKYPFLCVDSTTSIDDCSLDWIRVSDIRPFDEHGFDDRYQPVLDEYQRRTALAMNAGQGHNQFDPPTRRDTTDHRVEDEITTRPTGRDIDRAGRERASVDGNAATTRHSEATRAATQSQQPSDFRGTRLGSQANLTPAVEADRDLLYDIEMIDFTQEFLADAEPIPPQPHDVPHLAPPARMHSHTPSLQRVEDALYIAPPAVRPLAESNQRLNTASSSSSRSQDKDVGRQHHAPQEPPLSTWSLGVQRMRSGNVSPMSENSL